MYWGNIENRKMRKAYPQLRYYMFMALLARTDIDYIHEKLEEDSNWLSRGSSLLDTFLSFVVENKEETVTEDNDEPDEI